MGDGETYRFDAFDDGSWKLVGEQQMVKLKSFIQEYSTQLHEIEEALDETLADVWDFVADPIGLWLEPYEQTNVTELVKTDNAIFNKLTIIFSYLSLEIDGLKEVAHNKLIPALLVFGQEVRTTPVEGDAQVNIGNSLPFLREVSSFVDRCYSVAQNLVRQLSALYSKNNKIYQQSFRDVHLINVFYKLGDLFVILITLDEVINQNWELSQSWSMYRRMAKTLRPEATKFNTDEDSLLKFEKFLEDLEGQLFDGLIFQNCIEQDFECPDVVEVQKNALFAEEFFASIKVMQGRLTAPKGEFNELVYRDQFMGCCALYVFYNRLFYPKPDMKFFKSLWDLHKKTPVLHLAGNASWFPTDFFAKKIPSIVKALGKDANVEQWKRDYVKQQEQIFVNLVQNFNLQVSMWMIRMESNLTHKSDIRQTLQTRVMLMTRGLILAYDISNLFKEYIDLHTGLKIAVKPSHVRSLCQCIELIKAIQSTFHRRSTIIGESMPYMIQQVCFGLQRLFMPIRAKLEENKKYSDHKLDILAAIHVALQMLNGSGTLERRTVLRFALQTVYQANFLKDADVENISNLVSKLDLLCSFQSFLRSACDCSFLFWSRVLLPAYFQDTYQNPEQANRLNYMFAAFRDVAYMFSKAVHIPVAKLNEAFEKEIFDSFKETILDNLCRDIETDLRFHIHAHLKVSNRDPWKDGIKNLVSFVKLKPLRFFDKNIDIKTYVEHYLDTTFYNLNTVALFDWKTYAEMRNLANQKYLLDLTEVHLPGQTLEQGLDVLEIMRNIHIFVSRYHYNINNQIFVERTSDSKFLNTINITHIANSIRTHGTGIMNTTINFTFQFLKKKFTIFSQFLYDEHIKARLSKDIRYYKENHDKLDHKYPFDRADKFNKDIKKLGLTPDGLSYLDQFRQLITEIGNAMGYVRMVRSGGLHYTSNAIKFVPDLRDVLQFEELAKKEGLSPETTQAMHNLDSAIENLTKNFTEGTEYYKMLVSVFAPEFRDAKNAHLKSFYIILPPLIINFIDHSLIAKDKLTKKGGKEGTFTDDGFAIGIAYILKLLDLNKEFDALHWFNSIDDKYKEDKQNYQKQSEQKGVPMEEKQTLTLTISKINNYLREYEQFKYSFSGARIFFKD